ncbi:putative aldo-keto reductase (AKR) [Penicillium brasilianum]|uniref:Putative aldo-keto reductase (AKR) n=1 Tax=Penicillium brasilianum TaxID=104259 RepID=A0A1S9RTY1_PENBI|nr:putative aldo-keto reductase (AKR) [Penicillium brasilianum]
MARAVGKMWERYCLRPVGDSNPTVLPVFLYGTAWKKNRTADLVYAAVNAGFRAIDTAAQPRHYQEILVGDGIRKAIADGVVRREDLYVQTKFSPISAQDPDNMPYDPKASVTEQVHASIKSSLHNLRPSEDPKTANDAYIDTVVIHSPLRTLEQTIEVWLALETYVPHRIRNLGISNCSLPVLRALFTAPEVKVKPAVVQNRFYEDTLFDTELRIFCRENQIIYQSFWTLTANPDLVRSEPVQQLAAEAQISPAAALYTLVMGLGDIAVLNGTKNEDRMKEDLAAPLAVEQFIKRHPGQWEQLLAEFKAEVGDPN